MAPKIRGDEVGGWFEGTCVKKPRESLFPALAVTLGLILSPLKGVIRLKILLHIGGLLCCLLMSPRILVILLGNMFCFAILIMNSYFDEAIFKFD